MFTYHVLIREVTCPTNTANEDPKLLLLYTICNGMLIGYRMLTMFCRFGVCEPYNGTVEFCNGVLSTGLDYVFITKDHQSQENISRFLLENIPQDLLLAQDITDYCSNQISRVLCNYYLIPCSNESLELPPTSICPEECSVVQEICFSSWRALELGLNDYSFINCSDTTRLISPLSSCCTAVGIEPVLGKIVKMHTYQGLSNVE